MSLTERPTSKSRIAAPLLGLALAMSAQAADARPMVPGLLKDSIGMPCVPPCTICHRDNNGGVGTAIKPFVDDMIAPNHGFDVYQNPPNVDQTVKKFEAAVKGGDLYMSDADGDGVDDMTELKEGTDPNDATKGASVCGPEYGCVRVARGRVDGVAGVFSAMALLGGIGLMRRRRR